MVTALDAATRQSVIDQATAMAGPGGDPRVALFKYAQANGISPADLDAYMGFGEGTSQNFAVSSGLMAAPQGNYNPGGVATATAPAYVAPAPVYTPHPTAVVQPAPASPSQPAPSTVATPTAPAGLQPLSASERQQVINLAQAQAGPGVDYRRALLDYATKEKIGVQDIDTLMGYKPGEMAAWATKNVQGFNPSGYAESTKNLPPPPTWQDTFKAFNQKHIEQYGKEINRPWNEDADSRRAKQTIDDLYTASLKDYNTKYGTDAKPDGDVLGPTAQPNTYTPDKKEGNNILTKLATVAASVALAPLTVGASLWAGPALLGVSEAAKTGSLTNGVVTGLLSAAGAYGANGLLNGSAGAAGAAGASGNAAAGYTLTGDAIADMATLTDMGYSTAAAEGLINVGGAGAYVAGLGAGAAGAAGSGGLLSTLANGWNSLTGAATAAGGVNGSQLLSTGANLLGGYLNGQAAKDAAQTQSDAQIRAAQIAADAAKFRPVGVKTNFGQSQFGYDANGNLNSAGYSLDPKLADQQNQLMNAAPGMLGNFTNSQQYLQPMIDAATQASLIGKSQASLGSGMLDQAQQWRPDPNAVKAQTAQMGVAGQNAMALGNQYLQTSPQQQAAKYLAEQQGLLAPGRANDMASLQSQMQAQGRGGLMVGGGVNGQMASNPEMQALYNARMQQDAQLAVNATQGGMDYAKFGLSTAGAGGDMMRGMYDTQAAAYKPYETAQTLGQTQANYGIGMTGSAGQMIRDVFGTQMAAYAPYQQAMQGAQYLEGLGQNAMDIGLNVGAKGTAGNASGGMLLANGMTNAANTVGAQAQQGGSMWGNLLQGGARAFENYNQPAGTTYDPSKYRVVPL